MKKIILLLLATAIIAGCGGADKKDKTEVADNEQVQEQVVEIKLADFKDKAADLVGKKIMFTGIVDHTCRHGGKRMFLVDENSDAHLKVEAGEDIGSFDAEITGSTVKVIGVVSEKVVDTAYLDEWEAETLKKIDSEKNLHLGQHENGKEGDEKDEAKESFEKIKKLREQLEKSGKDHLSFYSVTCLEYAVLDSKPAEKAEEQENKETK